MRARGLHPLDCHDGEVARTDGDDGLRSTGGPVAGHGDAAPQHPDGERVELRAVDGEEGGVGAVGGEEVGGVDQRAAPGGLAAEALQ